MKQELIEFENWTIDTFNAGKLRSPVHLSGGNEDQLIEIFKDIKPNDWVFTTYRSHYHALLKGVPEQRLKDWILDNKSIHFMDKEHQVFSSAIVGGCLPIALGVAMAIKSRLLVGDKDNVTGQTVKGANHTSPHVYCFIGDMTASLGVFINCLEYAENFDLPITFIIEDNGLSTDTDTKKVWGIDPNAGWGWESDKIRYYKYKRIHPHYGSGMFVAALWKDIIDEEDPRKKGF